jgi:hypothetical protein
MPFLRVVLLALGLLSAVSLLLLSLLLLSRRKLTSFRFARCGALALVVTVDDTAF